MKSALPAACCFVVPEEALRTRVGWDMARMHVEGHDPLDRLREASRRYRSTRTGPRVQAVISATQGDTAPGIARAPGFRRRAVQARVAASNRGGLDARPDRPHPGRSDP